ncbi:PQQ-binding-like beta-propeller repeat protein [Streptomyces sp. MS1.AVA.1]|uniref:PQQ-binding-like beta-propeller repeat protein n=1 Tax=Streptomyces machairae TaxID=3134109 RepID=A0ABU8UJC7_9ACTN
MDDAMLVQQEFTPVAGEASTTTVAALDTGTGERLWHRKVANNGMSPAVSGSLVVMAADGARAVTARSARTGAERWTTPLPAGQYCAATGVDEALRLECVAEFAPSENILLMELDRADGSVRRVKVPHRGTLVGRSTAACSTSTRPRTRRATSRPATRGRSPGSGWWTRRPVRAVRRSWRRSSRAM